MLSHVRQYSFDDLERHHDYIQWLFPLREPSGANASAPLLSADDTAAFESDESLRKALLQSFRLMVRFYGLDLWEGRPEIKIVRGKHFSERRHVWLTRGNHNFLRISRILRSLTLLGLGSYALAFLKCLEAIYADEASTIGDTTIEYWRRSVR
ncbi:MAG TPA: opioid growth factor receptor-related protein [Vicinamibacterales bacterium]|nr:opioid growth factor receptor-related protein [Vicinamibacterales bacterium]